MRSVQIDTKPWHYESGEIKCYYGEKVMPMSKMTMDALHGFRKMVFNYIKMKRIESYLHHHSILKP